MMADADILSPKFCILAMLMHNWSCRATPSKGTVSRTALNAFKALASPSASFLARESVMGGGGIDGDVGGEVGGEAGGDLGGDTVGELGEEV